MVRELAEPGFQAAGQGLFQGRQTIRLFRHEQDHAQLVAFIRQLEADDGLVVEEVRAGVAVHHRQLDLVRAACEEVAGFGVLDVERPQPRRLEVDRVGQDEPRVHGQDAGLDQLLDLVVGLFLDPAIDGEAGVFAVVDEIDLFQPGPVRVLAELGELGEKAVVFLAPEAIGDRELAWPSFAVAVQLGDEVAKRWMETFVVETEPEGGFHLGGGVAARAGIGHGESGGET